MDRYRLAPVRDARDRDERIKRADLAGAASEARSAAEARTAATGRVATCRAAIADAVERRSGLLAAGTNIAELAALERYIARRRAELDALVAAELRVDAVATAAAGDVDLARGRLARARADRQVIERHFERWRTERRKLADRRDD